MSPEVTDYGKTRGPMLVAPALLLNHPSQGASSLARHGHGSEEGRSHSRLLIPDVLSLSPGLHRVSPRPSQGCTECPLGLPRATQSVP